MWPKDEREVRDGAGRGGGGRCKIELEKSNLAVSTKHPCHLARNARKVINTDAAVLLVYALVQSPAGFLKCSPVCFLLYRNLPSKFCSEHKLLILTENLG